MIQIHRETVVSAPIDRVWSVITTFEGVNAELMPLCRMSEPASLKGRTFDSAQPGERAVCWLLAGGLVPFDRHVLGLESVDPGAGFVEESHSWLQRRWRHQRTLTTVDGGTRVTDDLTIEPRLAVAAPLTRWMVGRIFDHRHRRLTTQFGV